MPDASNAPDVQPAPQPAPNTASASHATGTTGDSLGQDATAAVLPGDSPPRGIHPTARIHPTADVSPEATVGPGTRVWHRAHIREGAVVGADCIIGGNVYLDAGVHIGNRVKIQNAALVYHGVTIEDGVFVGPRVTFTNDLYPRAIEPEGELKTAEDWLVSPTRVCYGASIGAGAVVCPDLSIGRFAMVAAGAVVTRDVPDHALVMGCPARVVGYVCACGRRLVGEEGGVWRCEVCGRSVRLGGEG